VISGSVSVDQLSRRECRLFFTRTSAQSDDRTIYRLLDAARVLDLKFAALIERVV
jgi:hypothetical protein